MSVTNKQLVQTLNTKRVQLMAYIRAIVPDYHLAEDVYQEVSVEVVSHLEKIQNEKHLVQWLYRTSKHRAINSAKRKGRQGMLLDGALLDQYEGCLEEEAQELTGPRYELLQNCLGQLTPYARRLIHLRYSEGLTGQSLSDKLDRKIDTVYVALSRVHRALRTCLNKHASVNKESLHG